MRLKALFVAVMALVLWSGSAHAACGNGIRESGETCDDGNAINGDGCDNNCTFTGCGNGILTVFTGEECDPGPGGTLCCVQCKLRPNTAVCRDASDVCDLAEYCTGYSSSCPTDDYKSARTLCRTPVGSSRSAFESTRGPDSETGAIGGALIGSFVFRVGSGPVQQILVSSGMSLKGFVDQVNALHDAAAEPDRVSASGRDAGMKCQADAPGNIACRTNADCGSATCRTTWQVYLNSDYPGSANSLTILQDDTGLKFAQAAAGLDDFCDAAEFCTGSSAGCPADQYLPGTALCRASGGACDVAEYCPGQPQASCPFDTLVAALTECRASEGVCDSAETCDGRLPACPADAKEPTATTCRASLGGCDPAERCDGTTNDCPTDSIGGNGQICRYAAGGCDVAETCDGASLTCPTDSLRPSGTVCRSSAGQCDADETCTGYSSDCPIDRPKADATPCDDGQICTVYDSCVAGVCGASPETCGDGILQNTCSEQCDDGNTVDGDGCSSTCQAEPGLGCPFLPLTGCRQSVTGGKSKLYIRDEEKIGGLQFRWRWKKGAATTAAELGNPLLDPPAGTSYTLCVYDSVGLLVQATAPAGGKCGVLKPEACWFPRLGQGQGFEYRDSEQTREPSGVSRIDLYAGPQGKASISFNAEGGLFPLPSNGGFGGIADLSVIASPLLVQLQNSSGLCFESTYRAPFRLATPGRFLAWD